MCLALEQLIAPPISIHIDSADTGFVTGTEANVLYHTLNNETGTVIGSGFDNQGREITAWSGEKVLQFLTGPDDDSPVLPC